MKKVLFVYSKMIIGGSTTALLSILNNFDYSRYSVDLLLFNSGGEFFGQIPKQINVHILLKDENAEKNFEIKKRKSMRYSVKYAIAKIISIKMRNKLIIGQLMDKEYAQLLPPFEKEYDAAFSFLEYIPAAYTAFRINAKQKYTWLHLDYKEAKMLPNVEADMFKEFRKIIFVSRSCLEGFKEIYPDYSNKLLYIENIIDDIVTKRKAEESYSHDVRNKIYFSNDMLRIVSSSRIIFEHKGYDRMIRSLGRLERELNNLNYKWIVIGDGEDYIHMREMVEKEGISERVVFLGRQVNPFPIIKDMDLFVLPSRREGKPMAVTEALQLGVPVFVARYGSAEEQVCDGVDGIIVDNSEEAIYEGLKSILTKKVNLSILKENIKRKKYCDFSSLKEIYNLVENL